jgi:DNA-binding response OmpR family regulator
MKLLIIAGPYEADRIRKAAVAAGFETLAVEPGESLSGWINASRPDLIVMAPQIVHADPALALAKVRTSPRGRVPVFLVGEVADEERMRSLAEGFFVRPIAPDVLLAQARAILAPKRVQPDFERTEMGLGTSGAGASSARPAASPKADLEHTEMGLGSSLPALKPLVAAALEAVPIAAGRVGDTGRLLAELNDGIDAILDAELQSVLAKAPRAQVPAPEFAGEQTKKAEAAVVAEAAKPPKRKAGKAPAKTTGSTSPGMPSAPLVGPTGDDPRGRVLRRHALVQDGDYFAVLGVAHTATPDELQRAHAGVLLEISAPAVDDALARELSDQIGDIRDVADEALRVLSDQSLRPRYASHIS